MKNRIDTLVYCPGGHAIDHQGNLWELTVEYSAAEAGFIIKAKFIKNRNAKHVDGPVWEDE